MTEVLPAIYLKPPQGYLLAKGKKTLVFSPVRDENYVKKEIYVVSGDKIYAKIQLNTPHMVPYTLFDKFEKEHQISKRERESLWPDVKQFWSYTFQVTKTYQVPVYCGKVATHNLFIKEISPKKINEVRLYDGKSYRTFNLDSDELLIRMRMGEVDILNKELCLDGEESFKLFTPARDIEKGEGEWMMIDGKATFVKKKPLG